MPLVFVSYAHAEPAEVELARLIAERLRRDGAELFFDERLRAGQDWNEAIESALDRCDAFCPLLSATSLASPMVQNEIARVGERRRRHGTPAIWPIRCRHDGRLPYDIGAHLRRIQYLTWQGEADTAFTLDELLDRWRELRDGPQPEPLPPSLCTLPGRIADFTGREPEIADLIAALCREDRRAAVSAIGGMGGAGKTTLAIEAAWRMAGRFPDGILYVDMLGFGTAQPLTPAQALAAVIGQLEPTAKLPDRLEQLLPLYRRLLAGKKLLLVLDNARETTQVADLVPPPPVALLVTSRHRIFLDGASRLDLDVMPAEEARVLLRGIVDDHRATDAELDTLAERCGRLPLALRAAGAYLQFRPSLAVTGYLVLLSLEHRRLDHLRVPHANRDVRATLHLSFALLAAENSGLAMSWIRLAVFPTTFSPEAAAEVCNIPHSHIAEQLDDLVSRSLLGLDRSSGRYYMHDLGRDLAEEQLDTANHELLRLHFAKFYCYTLCDLNVRFLSGGSESVLALSKFDRDWPNIVFGQSWAADNQEVNSDAARLAIAYPSDGAYLLRLRQPAYERIRWLETALEVACRAKDQHSEVSILTNLGLAFVDTGQTARALGISKESLRIATRIRDLRGIGRALGNIGDLLIRQDRAKEALECYKIASQIAQKIDDVRTEYTLMHSMGDAWRALGNNRSAVNSYEQFLAVAKRIGDLNGEAIAVCSLANSWIDLGEARKAVQFCAHALDIRRRLNDRRGEGIALWSLARASNAAGNTDEAKQFARDSIAILCQTDHPFAGIAESWLRQKELSSEEFKNP